MLSASDNPLETDVLVLVTWVVVRGVNVALVQIEASKGHGSTFPLTHQSPSPRMRTVMRALVH